MLVLARKEGETIHIGDSIVIQLISCTRGRARIGISAPTEIPVMRGELVVEGLSQPLDEPESEEPPRLQRKESPAPSPTKKRAKKK